MVGLREPVQQRDGRTCTGFGDEVVGVSDADAVVVKPGQWHI
jgi:hypothetical protein